MNGITESINTINWKDESQYSKMQEPKFSGPDLLEDIEIPEQQLHNGGHQSTTVNMLTFETKPKHKCVLRVLGQMAR